MTGIPGQLLHVCQFQTNLDFDLDPVQLLDACIEIEQYGQVRSLNVHITGALMLWEHVRQCLP